MAALIMACTASPPVVIFRTSPSTTRHNNKQLTPGYSSASSSAYSSALELHSAKYTPSPYMLEPAPCPVYFSLKPAFRMLRALFGEVPCQRSTSLTPICKVSLPKELLATEQWSSSAWPLPSIVRTLSPITADSGVQRKARLVRTCRRSAAKRFQTAAFSTRCTWRKRNRAGMGPPRRSRVTTRLKVPSMSRCMASRTSGARSTRACTSSRRSWCCQ
mmetsp:Transcript_45713/g.105608  ORF Transcript_45713/g.105608 Transcript_45713/m.105608 type:complete len:217 (+) Transcript_45713:390-1040(+)